MYLSCVQHMHADTLHCIGRHTCPGLHISHVCSRIHVSRWHCKCANTQCCCKLLLCYKHSVLLQTAALLQSLSVVANLLRCYRQQCIGNQGSQPQCKLSDSLAVLQWCAQTVPACGSYQESLVGLLLPALAEAVSAQENGQTQEEALSSVMPQLLQVTHSSWPPYHLCWA